MTSIRTFPMPDVGEGLTEAEVLTWHVGVGDTVTVNQIMVEIETAKAAVELPSPYAGTVTALLVEPGVVVEVGTPIISIDTDVTTSDPNAPSPNGAAAGNGAGASGDESGGAKIGEMTADGRIATLVGYVSAGPSGIRRARRTAARTGDAVADELLAGDAVAGNAVDPDAVAGDAVAAQVTAADVVSSVEFWPAGSAPIDGPASEVPHAPKAAPQVRKLAKGLGVDLRTVRPARPDGVISRAEVEAAAAPRAADPDEPATSLGVPGPVSAASAAAGTGAVSAGAGTGAAGTRERRVPVKGIRKQTAQAMVASAFTAPHVTEFLTVDVTPMMELRDRLRRRPEFADVKLSPLAFAALAVCTAAGRTPEINAVWDGDAGEIVIKHYVHLGIAAATPRGLIVPVLKDADQLNLRELAVALGELTATARAGRTAPAAMTGGTFTITNVGIFGVDTGTPIINPGESAILALGSIKDAPWVVDGQLAVRKVCQLALSFDHRVVDGQQGSQFLADVGAVLADPALALVF